MAEDVRVDVNRQILGRIVRKAWVDYCRETGDTKPSHVAPWEELGEWDREADRRIGEAVVREVSKDAVQAIALLKDDLSAATERAERAEKALRTVVNVLGPVTCRCQGLQAEAETALDAALAALADAPREDVTP